MTRGTKDTSSIEISTWLLQLVIGPPSRRHHIHVIVLLSNGNANLNTGEEFRERKKFRGVGHACVALDGRTTGRT